MHRREFLTRVAAVTAYGLTPEVRARQRPLRVGVVGGGIVGASIALHLAQAGAAVTVFEKRGPAKGATENSFAWLNAFVPDARYRTLRLQSLQAYHDLDGPLKLGITWGGYIDWASNAAEAEAVRAAAAQLAGTPYAVRRIGPEDLTTMSPCIVPGAVVAAFFSAIDGHLDPVWVTRQFLNGAKAHGALTLYPCEVQGLNFRHARLLGVTTNRGAFPLDRLVVAAGIDTPGILSMAGFELRLRHAPGILAHSAPLAPLTPIIYEGPGNLTFKQMAGGQIVGTDSPEPPDLAAHAEIRRRMTDFPTEELRALHGNRILAKIAAVLPGARNAPLERLTLGFRPMPIDELPVVGAVPGAADVHVAVTHSGVTLAPILGSFVAQEVLDGSRLEALAPYRPDRFAGPVPPV
jgi:glycine/D-amino acid oxidase-like deaminating enzyme